MKRTILGVEIPQLIIPVAAGRDLVNLVETAAQQYKLIAAGYDAVAELDARLQSMLRFDASRLVLRLGQRAA